jgi:hypothetical protein
MNETPTLQDQLILYVFNELPEAGVAAFEHHLISDPQLQEDHRVIGLLCGLLQELPDGPRIPQKGNVKAIEPSPVVIRRLEQLWAQGDSHTSF